MNRRFVGQYEIKEPLGRGAMGVVYLAHQPSLKRNIAIKILNVDLTSDPSLQMRFEREAHIVASLQHNHIVPIFDYGIEDGIHYVAMPYISGGTLAQRYHYRNQYDFQLPNLQEIGRVVGQIAGALDYAHSKDIIHRDIKPSNIMFNEQGNVFITDFGIAHLKHASIKISVTGAILGTASYMPPEQWAGNQQLTQATDQYALAIVTYQLITGHLPFEGTTQPQMMHAHIHNPPRPMGELRPNLAIEIEEVINRALSKSPDERYLSTGEYAKALNHAITLHRTEPPTQFFQMGSQLSHMPLPSDSGIQQPPSSILSPQHSFWRSPIVLVVACLILVLGGVLLSRFLPETYSDVELTATHIAALPDTVPATPTPNKDALQATLVILQAQDNTATAWRSATQTQDVNNSQATQNADATALQQYIIATQAAEATSAQQYIVATQVAQATSDTVSTQQAEATSQQNNINTQIAQATSDTVSTQQAEATSQQNNINTQIAQATTIQQTVEAVNIAIQTQDAETTIILENMTATREAQATDHAIATQEARIVTQNAIATQQAAATQLMEDNITLTAQFYATRTVSSWTATPSLTPTTDFTSTAKAVLATRETRLEQITLTANALADTSNKSIAIKPEIGYVGKTTFNIEADGLFPGETYQIVLVSEDNVIFSTQAIANDNGIVTLSIQSTTDDKIGVVIVQIFYQEHFLIKTTFELQAEPTPTLTPTNARTSTPEPCYVSTDQSNIAIHVGPGFNRGVRTSLQPYSRVLVIGQTEDDDGNSWYKIQPRNMAVGEEDRYWVLQTDVQTHGDCTSVNDTQGSDIISGSPNNPVPNDTRPVIDNISVRGGCDDHTFVITWRDPDSNARQIVAPDDAEGESRRSISGRAGTYTWSGWYCTFNVCSNRFYITDSQGNTSNMVAAPDIRCN